MHLRGAEKKMVLNEFAQNQRPEEEKRERGNRNGGRQGGRKARRFFLLLLERLEWKCNEWQTLYQP
jgi:hypothetical protein